MKLTWTVALCVLCTALFVPPVTAQEELSFYGIKFGMNRESIDLIMPLQPDADRVRTPAHGMSSLSFAFDREGLLMEIRATYLIPSDPLEVEGLRQALQQKFVSPLRAAFPDVLVNLDEYSNRAGLTLVLISKGIRTQNVNHYRDEYLKKME